MSKLVEEVRGETDHCRHRLMKYCRGQGLDLGCGGTKIRTDAIGIDLYSPLADMNMDAQLLEIYPENQFDYIFSSHMLEEIQDTESTLREWLRVIKVGGHIVLYQADKELYYQLGSPECNPRHKHHFNWEELWEIFKRIGNTKLIHHWREPEGKEWSFELVVRKTGDGMENDEINEWEGISLIIPTLRRPFGMKDVAISADRTAVHPQNIEIVFGIHDFDTESIEMAEKLKDMVRLEVRGELIDQYPDKRAHLSFLWNQAYAKSKYPIIGYFGDDVIFHTPGWDEEVRKEFKADRRVMVACNDVHVQRGKTATLFFTHRSVHDKIGFYLSERLRRWYTDTYLDVIYKMARLQHYREDLITEHLHPDMFPERLDSTYQSMDDLKHPDIRLWNSGELRPEMQKYAQMIMEMDPHG